MIIKRVDQHGQRYVLGEAAETNDYFEILPKNLHYNVLYSIGFCANLEPCLVEQPNIGNEQCKCYIHILTRISPILMTPRKQISHSLAMRNKNRKLEKAPIRIEVLWLFLLGVKWQKTSNH